MGVFSLDEILISPWSLWLAGGLWGFLCQAAHLPQSHPIWNIFYDSQILVGARTFLNQQKSTNTTRHCRVGHRFWTSRLLNQLVIIKFLSLCLYLSVGRCLHLFLFHTLSFFYSLSSRHALYRLIFLSLSLSLSLSIFVFCLLSSIYFLILSNFRICPSLCEYIFYISFLTFRLWVYLFLLSPLFTLWFVVYFDQGTGVSHVVYWLKSFVSVILVCFCHKQKTYLKKCKKEKNP